MTPLLRIYEAILRGAFSLVGAMFFVAMLLISVDVIARYAFSAPIPWILEVIEHMIAIAPFLGMAWLVRHGDHIRVDVLTQALPQRSRRVCAVLATLIAALACVVAAYYAGLSTWTHYLRGVETYGIYPIPKYLLIAAITFGFAFTATEFLRKIGGLFGARQGASSEP